MTKKHIRNFIDDQNAATSIGFATVAVLVLLACFAAVEIFEVETNNFLSNNSRRIAEFFGI